MPFAVGTPGSTPMAMHSISLNETITIPNRRYFSNLTMPGNVLQCLPVIAETAYAAGQFPEAAVDGASATRWQPTTNKPSSFLINTTSLFSGSARNTKSSMQVGSLYFDWGARPPRNVTLTFANHTNHDNLTTASTTSPRPAIEMIGEAQTIRLTGITPSLPYAMNQTPEKVKAEEAVLPYVGNETRVDVQNGAYMGKWLRVTVEGCWVEDGVGATVSEVVVIPR